MVPTSTLRSALTDILLEYGDNMRIVGQRTFAISSNRRRRVRDPDEFDYGDIINAHIDEEDAEHVRPNYSSSTIQSVCNLRMRLIKSLEDEGHDDDYIRERLSRLPSQQILVNCRKSDWEYAYGLAEIDTRYNMDYVLLTAPTGSIDHLL